MRQTKPILDRQASTTMENQVTNETQNASTTAFKKPEVGDVIRGQIHTISGQVAFLQYGPYQPYINLSEFRNEDGSYGLNRGDEIEAVVVSTRSGFELSHKRMLDDATYDRLKTLFETKQLVEGTIIRVNRGGYEVLVEGVRAFCPSSQFASKYESDLQKQKQLGKTYTFAITEYSVGSKEKDKKDAKGKKSFGEKDRKNVVLSRKAVTDAEKQEKFTAFSQKFKADDVIKGTVSRIVDFGAFIRLDEATEGLLRASEVSFDRISHKSKLKVGDEIEVKVLSVDAEKQQIALSMKALQTDPWDTFIQTLKPFQAIQGTIVRLADFGAFVKVAEGVEGLLHVSSMSTERVEKPSQLFQEGQTLDLVVEEIIKDQDPSKRRLRLMTPAVAEASKPASLKLKEEINNVLKVKITEITDAGLSVDYQGIKAFIANSETNTAKGTKLADVFAVGAEIDARLTEIDRNKVRFSIKAIENQDKELIFAQYKKQERANASSNKLGSFADLLKGLQIK